MARPNPHRATATAISRLALALLFLLIATANGTPPTLLQPQIGKIQQLISRNIPILTPQSALFALAAFRPVLGLIFHFPSSPALDLTTRYHFSQLLSDNEPIAIGSCTSSSPFCGPSSMVYHDALPGLLYFSSSSRMTSVTTHTPTPTIIGAEQARGYGPSDYQRFITKDETIPSTISSEAPIPVVSVTPRYRVIETGYEGIFSPYDGSDGEFLKRDQIKFNSASMDSINKTVTTPSGYAYILGSMTIDGLSKPTIMVLNIDQHPPTGPAFAAFPIKLRDENYDRSPTVCSDLLWVPRYDLANPNSAIVIACKGSIYFIPTTPVGVPLIGRGGAGLFASKIGVGSYTSLAFHPSNSTLFVGTDVGIVIGMLMSNSFTTPLRIVGVNFIPSTPRPAIVSSVFVDTHDKYRVPIVFWGSDTGYLMRTTGIELTRAELVNVSTVSPGLSVTHMITDPDNDRKLLVLTPTRNDPTDLDRELNPRLLETAKSNCSILTCETCVHDPYCGYCYDTGSCSERVECPSGSAWNTQTQQCPKAVRLVPRIGSVGVATRVKVIASYYEIGRTYTCLWTMNGQPSYESNVLEPPTSNTVVCQSPSNYPNNNAQLTIRSSGFNWITAQTFSYYNCSSHVSCSGCNGQTNAECGWCSATASCSNKASCDTSQLTDALIGWSREVCPIAAAPIPDFVSSRGGELVTVPVIDFPKFKPETPFFCSWYLITSSYTLVGQTPATRNFESGDQSSTDSFTCTAPAMTPGLFENTFYSLFITSNGRRITTSSTLQEVYNCSKIARCDSCNSERRPACDWCGGSQRHCFFSAAPNMQCTSGSNACPVVTSISPNTTQQWRANSAIIEVTGTDLDQAADSVCLFRKGATYQSTLPEPGSTPTQVICKAPDSPTMSLGDWLVGLGYELESGEYLEASALADFHVYSCDSAPYCSECVSDLTPECVWCKDADVLQCSNTTDTFTCSSHGTVSYASLTCPTLTASNPNTTGQYLPVHLSVTGEHLDTSTAEIEKLVCSLESMSSVYYDQSNVTSSSFTSMSCDLLIPSIETTMRVVVRSQTRDRIWAEGEVELTVTDCRSFSTCDQCLAANCYYCGGTCAATCNPIEYHQAECPVLEGISPNFADNSATQLVQIRGRNFLNPHPTMSSSIDQKKKDLLNVLEMADASSLLALMGGSRRDTLDTLDLSYECRWEGLRSPATFRSTSLLECTAPAFTGIANLPMTVTLNDHPYMSSRDSFSFFSCPTSASDACSDECTAYPNCGWCVKDGMCQSDNLCKLEDVWQPKCVRPTLSQSVSTLEGGDHITIDLKDTLPLNANMSALSCLFGVRQSPATATYDTSTNSTTLSCVIPPSPSQESATLGMSVLYFEKKFSVPQGFTYTDCGQFKGCTKCAGQPNCGWCSGENRCSLQYKCTTSTWIKEQDCPIDKVALGVGLGLGLFFLLILVLVLAFLIRRAQKKRGLVITMKEPDYDAIAWGNDLELHYKIPDDKFRILNIALSRPDFVLPMSMALNCPATEQDSLAKALVYVACSHGLAVDMIRTVIRAEVANCLEENTLFRSNSVASKMYKFYSRIVGIKYLYHCIARVIMELETLGRKQERRQSKGVPSHDSVVSILDVTMELDTDKDIGDDVDTDTNLLQLQLICQKIINVLIKTALKNIPTELRQIFIEIDQSVSHKFPGSIDAVYKGLGGLFFLRFVCPAITAPHVYGLLESPPSVTTQRQLVLITKVIQSIANMQPPGKKEQYMEVMGSFIETSIPRIKKFYDNLRIAANISSQADIYHRDIRVPEEVLLNGLAATQTVLVREANKILVWLPRSKLDEASRNTAEEVIRDCVPTDAVVPKTSNKTASGSTPVVKKKKKVKKAN